MLSKYTIIEDCRPYYIRFTHAGCEDFCKKALSLHDTYDWSTARVRLDLFRRRPLKSTDADDLMKLSPISDDIELNYNMISYFVSSPGLRYRVHKDGLNINFSINYGIKIQDKKCYTRWYPESITDQYELDTVGGTSRELENVDLSKHSPLATMTAVQYECTLVNTSIWHEWDNSLSENERIVLTLRAKNYNNYYFSNAVDALFSKIWGQ